MAQSARGPIRVLSICTLFPNPTEPGCGIFVARRLGRLAARPGGPEVRVIAPLQVLDYANRRHRLLRSLGAPRQGTESGVAVYYPRWFYPPGGGAFNALFLAARLVPLCLWLQLRGFRFDLIDAHFGHPEGVAAALLGRLFRRPWMITMRGNEPVHASMSRARFRTQRWAFRGAACMIGVSEELRRFAVSLGVDESRAVTIPNGVSGETFHPRDREACRRNHGMEGPVIVSAGYLVEGKGHHDVARAMGRLRAQGIEARLWIVGGAGREGDFEPAIRAAVAEAGMTPHTVFTGAVPPSTLAELMCGADAVVLASYAEGWPNVVHEAMACGAPVVAARVGGVPEMIPSPEIGIVIPPRDAAALEAALAEALARKWDRAAIAAFGGSRTWDMVAGEVAARIETIVLQSTAAQRSAG